MSGRVDGKCDLLYQADAYTVYYVPIAGDRTVSNFVYYTYYGEIHFFAYFD